ncbi:MULTISPECIES: type I restriction endonuclease [Nitrosomonas]|uniref:Type I restriction enzyme R subunit n=1 Tax=Nitrosomonas communis TaxID=44574 RepID=A0A5D3Y7Y8_9PROT|nr:MULTISPECIES: type I restriction endonuclease [Nitrosomonas]TYP78785.1 type I restriction enzyme R subunit [Nitrosomonas communis]UVS61917.1 type I restriction endonuclease [Nitrosomonas sp. PLL12]
MTEDQLEQLALSWFQDTGWDYRCGPNIAPDGENPERTDYRRVLLTGRLKEALQRLNAGIPASVLDDVVHQLTKPSHPSLIRKIAVFTNCSSMVYL